MLYGAAPFHVNFLIFLFYFIFILRQSQWRPLVFENNAFHQGGGEETLDSVRRSESNLLPHTKTLNGCTKGQCS